MKSGRAVARKKSQNQKSNKKIKKQALKHSKNLEFTVFFDIFAVLANFIKIQIKSISKSK